MLLLDFVEQVWTFKKKKLVG
uniref:Uncharacterized protein n=1 Tax=Rhizophora mucronata TaxID=61149 RepID=A0A2P2ND18_RHIMU